MRVSRIILIVVCVVMLSATAVPADKTPDLEAGEILASHGLTSLDGEKTTLVSFRGEVVVVNFWASWCPPCRKELPVMDTWHKDWVGRGGRVVAISIDKDPGKARRFVDETGLSLTVLHDDPSGLARTLDLPAVPCTYLLDRSGNVVTMIRSSSEHDLARLRQEAEMMLGAVQTGGSR